MISKTNNLLVFFNMIVDTDIGVYEVLKRKYNNPNLVNPIINTIDIGTLLVKLKEERYNNILDMFIDSEKYNTEDLYNQLIEQEYDNILKYSLVTDVHRLMNVYIMSNVISVTVLCKNKQEEQIIKKMNKNFSTVILNDDLDIDCYDSIFLKNYKDIVFLKNIHCKNIFICDYQNNIDEEENIPLSDITAIVGKTNYIFTVNLHIINGNTLG